MGKTDITLTGFATIAHTGKLPQDVKEKVAGRRIEINLYDSQGSLVSLAGNIKISRNGYLVVPIKAKVAVDVKFSGKPIPLPPEANIPPHTSNDLDPYRETVPLKKLNTMPAATHCGRCGQPLVMPEGMGDDYKHCPKCEG